MVLSYRLVPVSISQNQKVNTSWAYEKLMKNKFTFGNADKKGIYFDEENRRHLYEYPPGLCRSCQQPCAAKGKKKKPKNCLKE